MLCYAYSIASGGKAENKIFIEKHLQKEKTEG